MVNYISHLSSYKKRPLKAVSVARTVECPQTEFEDLLHIAGKELGRLATIRTISSTRITFLESQGVDKAFKKNKHYDNESVRRFSYRMSHQLDQQRSKGIEVLIDENKPFKFFGRHGEKLALNVVPDDTLLEERGRIEEALIEEFGQLPSMRSFNPHITIGSVKINLLNEAQLRKPEILLPPEAVIPEKIALNGLSVYFDQKNLVHA